MIVDIRTSFTLQAGPGLGNVSLAQAVPEPATWAMLIIGFGAVGGAMRRRAATVTN